MMFMRVIQKLKNEAVEDLESISKMGSVIVLTQKKMKLQLLLVVSLQKV